MNQNRSCPGVPNRYKIRSLSNVIRPKSIATVVVVFPGSLLRSSTPTLAAVITASVVNGVISDTAPTSVVFPTPNPPAMTIFTACGALFGSDLTEAIEHPFQKRKVRTVAGVLGAVDQDVALLGHVADEDAGDPEGDVQAGGDLRDRQDVAAQQRDRAPVDVQRGGGRLPRGGGGDERLQLQLALVAGARAAAGDRVRPHDATRLVTVVDAAHGRFLGHRGGRAPVGRGAASPRQCSLQLGAQRGREHVTGPGDQHRHLVADQTDVAVQRGQDGQARAVADEHDEQEALLHLDHGLVDPAAAEVARGALGQAGQAGGDRGELVGGGPVQVVGHRDEQPVGRDHDCVDDPRHVADEVRDEPVEILGFSAEVCHFSSWVLANPPRTRRRPARTLAEPRGARARPSATTPRGARARNRTGSSTVCGEPRQAIGRSPSRRAGPDPSQATTPRPAPGPCSPSGPGAAGRPASAGGRAAAARRVVSAAARPPPARPAAPRLPRRLRSPGATRWDRWGRAWTSRTSRSGSPRRSAGGCPRAGTRGWARGWAPGRSRGRAGDWTGRWAGGPAPARAGPPGRPGWRPAGRAGAARGRAGPCRRRPWPRPARAPGSRPAG